MLFKESPDRPLIQKARQHCVQQKRSLSHEFDCLNDLFGMRQRRDLDGQPRKYLLRRIDRPLVLRPRQRLRIPQPPPEPLPKRLIDLESASEPETESESEQWSQEPMDRIVFQFAHTAPDTEAVWSVTEEETTPAVDWEPDELDGDLLLAETCVREQVEEARQLRERYDEYRRSVATQSQSDMECELRSIQTLQIVVGETTVYCQ